MQKLIIHVGTPKTGTSTLQRMFFDKSDDQLERKRILYPIHNHSGGCGKGRVANASILQPEYYNVDELVENFEQWFSMADTVFLSEEVLFLDNNMEKIQYLRNNDVQIVIMAFFRNAAEYLSSLWMEFNRFENRRIVSSLTDFMKGREYLTGIGNLMSLVASNPEYVFHFCPYRPKRFDKNSVVEALEIIGSDLDPKQFENYNESMTRLEADIRQLAVTNHWQFGSHINSDDIKKIAAEIKSGDRRPVIETLSDDIIEQTCLEHEPFLDYLMRVDPNNRNVSFKDIRPSCFGK